jgi:hypothetical protein
LSGTCANASCPDHDIESGIRERHVEGIAEPDVDQVIELDQLGQADRALMAALGDVQPGDPAAEPVGQVAGGPAHPAAHVEHVCGGPDARLLSEYVDRLQPAEMTLVVVLQDLLAQRRQVDTIGAQPLEDLVLIDRMGLIEVNDRVDARLQVQAALPKLCPSILGRSSCAVLDCPS